MTWQALCASPEQPWAAAVSAEACTYSAWACVPGRYPPVLQASHSTRHCRAGGRGPGGPAPPPTPSQVRLPTLLGILAMIPSPSHFPSRQQWVCDSIHINY